MKRPVPLWLPLCWIGGLALAPSWPAGAAQPPLALEIQTRPAQLELSWRSTLPLPLGNSVATYDIQVSDHLGHWQTVGTPIAGRGGIQGERLRTWLVPDRPQAFYRLVGRATTSGAFPGGAEVFGYGSALARHLDQLGPIAPEQFAALYPAPTDYLDRITFDPTAARYWPEMHAGFPLHADELAVLRRNGFVVSERLGGYSMAEVYYQVFTRDLPVFVSTDSVLQAWHYSYQSLLLELEEVCLRGWLQQMLEAMVARVPSAWQAYGQGALRDSVLDADYLLTVARQLLGQPVGSALGQDGRVARARQAIEQETFDPCFDLFGRPRAVDFSQFKVRGHYATSPTLSRYFQAMMWLGRVELRLAGGPYQEAVCAPPQKAALRELGTALVLHHLLMEAGQFESWQRFDRVLQSFVGMTDALTFASLGDLLAAAGIRSPADAATFEALMALQRRLEDGQIGVAQIRADYLLPPLPSESLKLPVAFTVMGQRFVLDSWVFSEVVYGNVWWQDPDGHPFKVTRRIPSCLDVAFAALGNNQVVPELVARLKATDGRAFRDGLPYQHNLAALRRVIDEQSPQAWETTIYQHWLATLRTLSAPTTEAAYPETLRTRAWAMKTLNTQLASWTQLRHDTLLYAKQSYTEPVVCDYPAGYVEPRVDFWQRLTRMAQAAADLVRRFPWEGRVTIFTDGGFPMEYDLADLQNQQAAFLLRFAQTTDQLRVLAEKELARQPFSPDEVTFLRSLIEDPFTYVGVKNYSGWYPSLFYRGRLRTVAEAADQWDPLVADVHTDTPDEVHGDPGCVLHQGVGNPHLLILAVDCGAQLQVYAGPVLSHYEFEMPPFTRKSDAEWKADLRQGKVPPAPVWTRDYLVPGPYTVPPDIE